MTITYAQRISNRLATLRSDNSARGACEAIAAEADAEIERLRAALQNLLDDTQHAAHANCEDGPCPVREYFETLKGDTVACYSEGDGHRTVTVLYSTLPSWERNKR